LRHLRIDRRVHPGDSASNPAGIRNANAAAIKSAKYDNVNACKWPTQLSRHSGAREARTRNLEIPGLVLRTIPE
jgi:hypothetical protein